MTAEELRASARTGSAPAGAAPSVLALWHDARGDWDLAHEAAQADRSAAGAWVHAYLHRKEGDEGNARYWYSRAGRPPAQGPLKAEWADIASELLRGQP